MNWMDQISESVRADAPILIAGPTASGKSSLALHLAEKFALPIVNADAIQVFSDWRILTARPSDQDEQRATHLLYGHVPGTQSYSVGDWLREVEPILAAGPCIVVGGTGLNFSALTEGLADIPETSKEVRAQSEQLLREHGLSQLLLEIDDETKQRIDYNNPRRVQRAWEVLKETGRGLSHWQDETGEAMCTLDPRQAFLIDAPKDWLTPRIEQRFDMMIDEGVVEEARANADEWSETLPSAKAIGARELIEFVQGELDSQALKTAICTQTRQYAKRQRTWFRKRMRNWTWIQPF